MQRLYDTETDSSLIAQQKQRQPVAANETKDRLDSCTIYLQIMNER